MVSKLFEGDRLIDGAVRREEGFAKFAEAETAAEAGNKSGLFAASGISSDNVCQPFTGALSACLLYTSDAADE